MERTGNFNLLRNFAELLPNYVHAVVIEADTAYVFVHGSAKSDPDEHAKRLAFGVELHKSMEHARVWNRRLLPGGWSHEFGGVLHADKDPFPFDRFVVNGRALSVDHVVYVAPRSTDSAAAPTLSCG